ncbi:hypothetical protein ACKWTF_001364 [Chironomus riparius]
MFDQKFKSHIRTCSFPVSNKFSFPYHVHKVYKFVIKSRQSSILCFNFHLICLKLWKKMKLLLPILLAVLFLVQFISYAEASHHHEIAERNLTNSSVTEQKGIDDKVLNGEIEHSDRIDEDYQKNRGNQISSCLVTPCLFLLITFISLWINNLS